jgi:hypothetical protein
MDDFPKVAYFALYWAALGLGGAVRGRGAVMLRSSLVVGVLVWAAIDLLALGQIARALAVAAMGASYGHARSRAMFGAVLALPILLCDWLLTALVSQFVPLSTLGFAFWLFQFAAEVTPKDATKPERSS